MPPPGEILFVLGDLVYVHWAITNDSRLAVADPFQVGIAVDGVVIITFPVSRLGPGDIERELNIALSIEDAGQHELALVVDVDGRVTESDESDNAFAIRPQWVAPTPTPTPTVRPTPTITPTPTVTPTSALTPTPLPPGVTVSPTVTPTPTLTPTLTMTSTPTPDPAFGTIVASIVVGDDPYYLAFDGNHVWASLHNSQKVVKIDPATNAVVGSFPTNGRPTHVLFDGMTIWVATNNPGALVQIRPSDGVKLNEIPLGNDDPGGLAFDGTNVWVSRDTGGLGVDGEVSKVRVSDGAITGSYIVSAGPRDVVFDGVKIWVANYSDRTITMLQASDGKVLDTFPTAGRPIAMVFDGSAVWVGFADLRNDLSYQPTHLQRLEKSAGIVKDNYPSGPVLDLEFDGSHVWVSRMIGNEVSKYRAADGQSLGVFRPNTGQFETFGILYALRHIWVANTGTGTNDVVTRVWAGPPVPTPTPIAKIAFTSYRDGNAEVYVMNSDGLSQVNLTNHTDNLHEPKWSPNGMRIVFASDRDGNTEVYTMASDGGDVTRLTNNAKSDAGPARSPDGTKIVFDSTRDGNSEIYVMNADGSAKTRLTSDPLNDFAPSFSPDGSKIAFTSDREGTGKYTL